MNSDLTFITNEKNQTLLDRFRVLIKDTLFFDVLVGYFYTSGRRPWKIVYKETFESRGEAIKREKFLK